MRGLGELLALLLAEADPALPPWYSPLNEVARRGRLQRPPGRDALVAALRAR